MLLTSSMLKVYKSKGAGTLDKLTNGMTTFFSDGYAVMYYILIFAIVIGISYLGIKLLFNEKWAAVKMRIVILFGAALIGISTLTIVAKVVDSFAGIGRSIEVQARIDTNQKKETKKNTQKNTSSNTVKTSTKDK